MKQLETPLWDRSVKNPSKTDTKMRNQALTTKDGLSRNLGRASSRSAASKIPFPQQKLFTDYGSARDTCFADKNLLILICVICG
jgi:hypothetical protein